MFAQRVIPVVVCEDVTRADDLARALVDGGLPVAEVTFRTAGAERVIESMSRHEELLVGAGTVTNPKQVATAVDAGARFVVSPGLHPEVVHACQEAGVPVFPGVVTPSEILAALALGLTRLKFFPAGTFGGIATLKSYASPFGQVSFIPTGGVTAANLADYLSLPNVVAVGGSWMVAPELLAAGDFAAISRLAAEAVAIAAGP